MINRNFAYLVALENIQTFHSILLETFSIVYFYKLYDGNILLAFMPGLFINLVALASDIPTAKLIGKLGTRLSMQIGLFIWVLGIIPIYILSITGNPLYIYIWLFSRGLAGRLYFTSKLILLGRYTDHTHRGRQFSWRRISLILTGVVVPVLGGIILETYDFIGLMLAAVIVLSMAAIPMAKLDTVYFQFGLNFRKVISERRVRKLALLNFVHKFDLDGGRSLWSIFLFLALSESYLNLGFFMTAVSAVTMLAVFVFGIFIDTHSRAKSLEYSSLVVGLSYLLRVVTAIPVLIVDLFWRISDELFAEVHEVVDTDLLNDNVTIESRDEHVVMREVIVHFLGACAYLLIGVLGQLLGFQAAFATMGLIMICGGYLAKKYRY